MEILLLFIIPVLDLLVIWDILKGGFETLICVLLILMILFFPVLGIVVYHFIKPHLPRKEAQKRLHLLKRTFDK